MGKGGLQEEMVPSDAAPCLAAMQGPLSLMYTCLQEGGAGLPLSALDSIVMEGRDP